MRKSTTFRFLFYAQCEDSMSMQKLVLRLLVDESNEYPTGVVLCYLLLLIEILVVKGFGTDSSNF